MQTSLNKTVSACLVTMTALLTVAATAFAELPPLARKAIDTMNTAPLRNWAYTVTIIEGSEKLVERFDPTLKGEGWVLLEVNGRKPDDKDRQRYAREYEDREDRDHPGDNDLDELIDASTLELIEESSQHATYGFQPLPEDSGDEDMIRHLRGKMIVNKAGTYVESVELYNIAPFSPQPLAKINKLRFKLEFSPANASGPVFLHALTSEVDGKMMGIKRFSERETITVSDFTYVGQ